MKSDSISVLILSAIETRSEPETPEKTIKLFTFEYFRSEAKRMEKIPLYKSDGEFEKRSIPHHSL